MLIIRFVVRKIDLSKEFLLMEFEFADHDVSNVPLYNQLILTAVFRHVTVNLLSIGVEKRFLCLIPHHKMHKAASEVENCWR
jgi:hypothetical protein